MVTASRDEVATIECAGGDAVARRDGEQGTLLANEHRASSSFAAAPQSDLCWEWNKRERRGDGGKLPVFNLQRSLERQLGVAAFGWITKGSLFTCGVQVALGPIGPNPKKKKKLICWSWAFERGLV